MNKIMAKTTEHEAVKYLFWGGCTTGLNLAVFTVLRYAAGMKLWEANLISIVSAMVFAFLVNKWFVFSNGETDIRTLLGQFTQFMGMRVLTFAVEFWGVGILSDAVHIPDGGSKVLIQAVVVVLNYVISKFYVFKS